jgi:NAD+ kinase
LQGSGSGTQSNTRVNGQPPRSGSHMHQASSSRHPRIPGHQARQALHQSHAPNDSSAGSSRVTSPTDKRGTSMSGYESDKSSALGGSAFLDGDVIDDDDDTGSLTRQLAETAQGVREMSKQLGESSPHISLSRLISGRTRVRSKIQTVLIVTKARDNRLIKLTRELALYLMQKRPIPPSENPQSANSHTSWNSKTEDRGMIVYVDAQLRHSKRFDAAGLQQDHPEFFRPLHRRRSSSSASVNNVSSWSSGTSLSEARKKDEGQLRYWTSEMCSSAPHLFDFVVTVSSYTSTEFLLTGSSAETEPCCSLLGYFKRSYRPSYRSLSDLWDS